MTDREVWQHGDSHAKRPDGKLPLGRADFGAGAVPQTSVREFVLRLEISEPPPRHANILGWPDPSQPELRNQLAIELRERAKPIVRDRDASAA